MGTVKPGAGVVNLHQVPLAGAGERGSRQPSLGCGQCPDIFFSLIGKATGELGPLGRDVLGQEGAGWESSSRGPVFRAINE